jgi:hypothetical protein
MPSGTLFAAEFDTEDEALKHAQQQWPIADVYVCRIVRRVQRPDIVVV